MAQATGKAGSKVILSGEHFVVHGCPALAVPVPLFLEVTLSDESLGDDKCTSIESVQESSVKYALEVCQNYWKGEKKTLFFSSRSEIPRASGMGSSAAFSVAFVRAYASLFQKKLSLEETFQLSMEIEKKPNNNPSGIDSAIITYEKPISFTKGEGHVFLSFPGKVGMIVVDTRQARSTSKMVKNVQDFKDANPEKFATLLSQAKALVAQFKQHLEDGNREKIGDLACENHELLRQVGVHSPATDDACQKALNAGALGAKMTGGGGGGVILAFCSPEKLEKVSQNLGPNTTQNPFPPLIKLLV